MPKSNKVNRFSETFFKNFELDIIINMFSKYSNLLSDKAGSRNHKNSKMKKIFLDILSYFLGVLIALRKIQAHNFSIVIVIIIFLLIFSFSRSQDPELISDNGALDRRKFPITLRETDQMCKACFNFALCTAATGWRDEQ